MKESNKANRGRPSEKSTGLAQSGYHRSEEMIWELGKRVIAKTEARAILQSLL